MFQFFNFLNLKRISTDSLHHIYSHTHHLHHILSLLPVIVIKFTILCVCVCVCQSLSHVRLYVTQWTVARQAPLPMKFSKQEYWNGLPSPGDLPNPGTEPVSPALQADSLPSEPSCSPSNPVPQFCSIFYFFLPFHRISSRNLLLPLLHHSILPPTK